MADQPDPPPSSHSSPTPNDYAPAPISTPAPSASAPPSAVPPPPQPPQQHHAPPQASPAAAPPGPIRTQSSASRPVHSCSECRRKKLRCDRERPCHQCQKSRRTSLCSYDNVSTPRTKARGPYHRSSHPNGGDHHGGGEVTRFRVEVPESKPNVQHNHTNSNGTGEGQASSASSYGTDQKPSHVYSVEPGYAPVRHGNRADTAEAPNQPYGEPHAWNAVNAPRNVPDSDYAPPRLPPIHTHEPRIVEDLRRDPAFPDISVIEDLQRRVQKLEEALLNRHSHGAYMRKEPLSAMPSGYHGQSSSIQAPRAAPGQVVVKHQRTRFHGACDKMAMFRHFDEAVQFLEHSSRDPVFKADMSNLQKRFIRRPPANRPLPDVPELPYDLAHELLLKMPSEIVCKNLVRHYLGNFETATRILHVPEFLQQTEKLWNDKQLPSDDFTPQLAAVIVMGSILTPASQLTTADGQLWNVAPLLSLLLAWEQRLQGKALFSFAILQTRCLLLLARHLNGSPATEISRVASGLVRAAMMMGLHSDPGETPQITPFQAELRRRVWYTIVEIDLQTSLCCGMPPTVHPDGFTTRCPANVDDQDLLQMMAKHPVGRPGDQWTDSTFQVVLAQSASYRLRAATASYTGEEMLTSLAPVNAALSEYSALRAHRTRGIKGPAGDALGDMVVESHLLRSLICGLPNINIEAAEARNVLDVIFRGVQTVLGNLEQLDPNIVDGSIFGSGRYWNAYAAVANDLVVTSALILCAAAQGSAGARKSPQRFDALSAFASVADLTASGGTKSNILRTVDGLIASIIANVDDLGRYLKDIVCLALALQCARSPPDSRDQSMREGVHRTVERCNYRARHDANNFPASGSLLVNIGMGGYEDDSLFDLLGFEAGAEVDGAGYDAANGHP